MSNMRRPKPEIGTLRIRRTKIFAKFTDPEPKETEKKDLKLSILVMIEREVLNKGKPLHEDARGTAERKDRGNEHFIQARPNYNGCQKVFYCGRPYEGSGT